MSEPAGTAAAIALRPFEPQDIDAIFDVYRSNVDYLALTEGAAGEPGRYERAMLERDLALVGLTGREYLVAIDGAGELVGVVDWMAANPSDGEPWLGLVMVHADRQRQGIALAAFAAFRERLQATAEVERLRAGVIEGNEAGTAFARRLGFIPIDTVTKRLAGGEQRILILELAPL